jgi:hypothetical protein
VAIAAFLHIVVIAASLRIVAIAAFLHVVAIAASLHIVAIAAFLQIVAIAAYLHIVAIADFHRPLLQLALAQVLFAAAWRVAWISFWPSPKATIAPIGSTQDWAAQHTAVIFYR